MRIISWTILVAACTLSANTAEAVVDIDALCPPRAETAARFKAGSYPPAARPYREAAKMAYRYMVSLPAMTTLVETGRPSQKYQHNAYVSKTHAAHIEAMLDWMRLEPEMRETAMRFAKASAEFLLKELEPVDASLAFWPPTYGRKPLEFDPKADGPYKKTAMVGNEPEGAFKYRGEVMLLYPASAGIAFVDYWGETKDGRFLAEGVVANDGYRYDGLWTSENGASWTRLQDESERGLPALDCGEHAVKLSLSGTGNGLAGGLYAPAVRVASGASLDVAAQGPSPAALQAFGNRYSAAFGGGLDEDAGAFVQRSATIIAVGGDFAPDIGPGRGGAATAGATILGGSLLPAGGGIEPAPSNGVEAVRCVVVGGLAPGQPVSLANLPAYYGTDGVVADANGRVYLWLPAAAESFRFIADGSLRRVPAGGGNVPAETLPDPKVETATFAPVADRGETALEVKMRVFSPVEAEALAPVYSSDLSALSSGSGDRLAPSRVEQVGEDEYELTFRLPSSDDSGFFVIQAK